MSARRSAGDDRPWLVFFGEDWGRHNFTGQYLAERMGARRRVLWVNSLGMRSPRLTPSDLLRVGYKAADFLRSLLRPSAPVAAADVPEHVTIVSPLVIPFFGSGLVRAINRRLLRRYLRRQAARLGIQAPDVVAALPTAVDALDALDGRCTIYYCADEYGHLSGNDPVLLGALEKELIRRVDLVAVVSRELLDLKSPLHPDVRYFPHGVDHAMFAQAVQSPSDPPAELADLPPPLIGYTGLIADHLDLDLVDRVAERHPQATVVMIGPTGQLARPLPRRDNIVYLGPKPHASLPGFLACFDVCLLPWLESERNRFANPTKLREYLAAGRPVVSTRHREVGALAEEFEALRMCDTAQSFVDAVGALLGAVSLEDRLRQSRAMRGHDWTARTDLLLDWADSARESPPAPGWEPPSVHSHRSGSSALVP